MPAEVDHHIEGGIGLAAMLAAAGGFVDAWIFLRVVSVFVGNMSGNLIRLGIATGQGLGSTALAASVALWAFMTGVAAAAAHVDRRLVRQRPALGRSIFLAEAVLFLAIAGYVAVLDIGFSTRLTWTNVPVVVLGAFAMGMQAIGLRRVGATAVSTTYGTGAVVRLSEKLMLAQRRAPRPGDVPRRSTMVVLAAVLLAYVVGAIAASMAGQSPAWLLVPAGLQMFAALVPAEA